MTASLCVSVPILNVHSLEVNILLVARELLYELSSHYVLVLIVKSINHHSVAKRCSSTAGGVGDTRSL